MIENLAEEKYSVIKVLSRDSAGSLDGRGGESDK